MQDGVGHGVFARSSGWTAAASLSQMRGPIQRVPVRHVAGRDGQFAAALVDVGGQDRGVADDVDRCLGGVSFCDSAGLNVPHRRRGPSHRPPRVVLALPWRRPKAICNTLL
ncbi:hypothetical protein IM697_04785 [Streptomyces ferrugineus]|uniref:Uncharacterized protein n=1 Tax=Streptomyces ferrugineus TaxID=1413221 RepID=A0A7M2SR59_9ACTN|nr:hypothetical protein [Streptomyces ferrugineus]QOV37741.1 hypothetical protein IM697_04785 [Streptomyces ferrugineus]